MDKMQIYNCLPIWVQNLACYAEGRRIVRTRYGEMFWDKLAQYESRKDWSYSQLCEYRDEQLQKIIRHAYATVPYYKELFDEGGINPRSITHLEELKRLPVLTKDDIKKNPEAFLSTKYDKEKLVSAHTSGTTGAGFIFKTTQEAMCEQWAVWWRYRRNIGIQFDDWCALMGGRSVVPIEQSNPPFFRWNKPCRQMYFSTYHMKEDNLKYYVNEIQKNDIKWIHGYPSALNLLADYLIKQDDGLDIGFITTGAENLFVSQKGKIREAFGQIPYQHYGLSEGTADFSEDKQHIMKVDEDFAAVEFVDNEQGTKEIIGTNLTNYAMPFIRYNTGDVCEVSETSQGRVITSLDGRKEEYLILSDGTKVGRLDHIFKDMMNVREAQFVQKAPGHAELKIVKGSDYSEADEKKLKQEIYSRLKNTDIQFNYVEEIERTKSGKFRFVISG